MTMHRVSAAAGWDWFACGWQLFMMRPWLMVGAALLFFLFALVAGLIPVVGAIAFAIASPLLAGGWYRLLAAVREGGSPDIGALFSLFSDTAHRGPLMIIGVVMLAAQVFGALLVVAFAGGGMMAGMEEQAHAMAPMILGAGGLVALVVILTIGVMVAMAVFFAVPLVVFGNRQAVPAMRESLVACWRNMLPLSVFGLVYLVLAFLAAIPAGLGFLLLLPVTVAAAFCAYRSVFGREGGGSLEV